MRPRSIRQVAGRHLREILREKRTFFMLLTFPVIVVLLFSISRDELIDELGEQLPAQRFTVGIEGERNGRDLVRFLRRGPFKLVLGADLEQRVRDGELAVVLQIPRGFDRDVDAGERPTLGVLVSGRSFEARVVQSAVAAGIDSYRNKILRAHLRGAGLPGALADPIAVHETDLSTAQERTGSLLAEILPFMVLAQVVGMMTGTATDATVGEKERRTIEALLATPLTRREIVGGKWLVIVGLGALAAALTLATGIVSFRFATSTAKLIGSAGTLLPAGAYLKAGLAMLAFIMLIASVQVLLGFVARSQQQAGIMLSPVFFLAIFPLFFFEGQSGAQISTSLYAIPGLGAALLARNGLAGSASAAAPAIVLATHLAYAIVVLFLADRVVHSERALLRVSG